MTRQEIVYDWAEKAYIVIDGFIAVARFDRLSLAEEHVIAQAERREELGRDW